VHVAGPEYMSRLEFARRAARCLGLPGEHIVGTATAQLGQRARRPLRGGLQTDLLTTLLPGFLMSSVEMALASY
jgi:dTDP-4-dehydrorhamnose reductase